MGYKAKKKLYLLRFVDDPEMEGLEITMSSVSMGTLLELQEMSTRADEVARDKTEFRKVIDIFAGAMLSWNLEDDFDQPVPITADGILTQDPDFVMRIVAAWTKAISGVADPLDGRSTSGGPSPEASLPMEPVSPNLRS